MIVLQTANKKQAFDAERKVFKSLIDYKEPNVKNLSEYVSEALNKNSHLTLLVDAVSAREWTGSKLKDLAQAIGIGLIKNTSVCDGKPVFIMSEHNDLEFIVSCGVFMAGGSFLSSSLKNGFLENQLYCQLAKPQYFFIQPEYHQEVIQLKKSVPECKDARIVWIDVGNKDDVAGSTLSQDLSELATKDNVCLVSEFINFFSNLSDIGRSSELDLLAARQKSIKPTHNGYFCITSGSTGKPKFVCASQVATIHQLNSIIESSRQCLEDDDKDTRILSLGSDTIFATDLPIDSGAGFCYMMAGISIGMKIVVLPAYNVDTFWKYIHKYQITTGLVSCTFGAKLFQKLAELIIEGKHSNLNFDCLRFIMTAGSKLSITNSIKTVNEVYKNLRIFQCYGISEIALVSSNILREAQLYNQSVGYLTAGFKARILDLKTNTLLNVDEKGELLLNSKNMFTSYFTHLGVSDAEQRRNEILWTDPLDLHDVYYKTGDLAHFDAEGRLYLHGRIKETLLLMKDYKITPLEIEVIINRHPLVAESAVVGVPDTNSTGCDLPRAYCKLVCFFDENRAKEAFEESSILRNSDNDTSTGAATSVDEMRNMFDANDCKLIEKDIFKFVSQRVINMRRPNGGVRIIEKFPQVGTMNKIDRRKLREIALNEWKQENDEKIANSLT